jgi:hypothetical protein
MSSDELFPPVDPVDSMVGIPKVVPRRKRFGPRSKELYNQMLKEQKDLRELKGNEPLPNPSLNGQYPYPSIDRLA